MRQMSPSDLSDDVMYTLLALKASGIKLAIGSSSKNTPLILERIGLENFFEAVADGNSISRSKPDPEVFLKAAEMLRLKPSECLVVDDACSGIEAAQAGGFDSAAIGYAAHDSRAEFHLLHLSKLLEI